MGEELKLQQSHEIRQGPAEGEPELQVLENRQRDQRRPGLRVEGVGTGPDEGLDLEMLLQRLKLGTENCTPARLKTAPILARNSSSLNGFAR